MSRFRWWYRYGMDTTTETNPNMTRIDSLRAQLADVPPKHRHYDRLFGPLVPTIDSSRYPDGLLTTERWGGQVNHRELEDTRKKVERLAKRARKYNLPEPTCDYRSNPDGTFDVLIAGLDVRLPGGWMVVAVIDHAGDGMATVAPGAPEGTFARWNLADPKCDECGKAIRRSKTIVVRDEDGNEKQVGGQCATTFLGMTADVAWTVVREHADEDEWFGQGGSGHVTLRPVAYVLAVAVAVTRTFGWVSKANADETGRTATAELVQELMAMRGERARQMAEEVNASYDVSSDEHKKYMDGLYEWAATIGGSDYLDSLRFMITEAEGVTERRFGLLASAPQAYDRAIAERMENERRETGPVAEVPVVSGRITVVGEVQRTKEVFSDYGVQYKMLVATDAGYRLWGTIPSSIDVDTGDRVEFTARVERSRDDATFGFYSRPTKARVLAA